MRSVNNIPAGFELSPAGYKTVTYRFMAASAERWRTVNAEYATFAATGAPGQLVLDVCPFDAAGLSALLMKGLEDFELTELPWRVRKMQLSALRRAAKNMMVYMPQRPYAVLLIQEGLRTGLRASVIEVEKIWRGKQLWSRDAHHTLAVLESFLVGCSILMAAPGAFEVTTFEDPFQFHSVKPVENATAVEAGLMAEFDERLSVFFDAVEAALSNKTSV